MKIKICGLTKAENSRQVAMLGADAIVLFFYAQSPRCVSAKTAVEIMGGGRGKEVRRREGGRRGGRRGEEGRGGGRGKEVRKKGEEGRE